MLWIWIIVCVFVADVIGETVYLEDLSNDHDRRNLDFGLPETLTFRLVHANGIEDLRLKENKRLNAIHAPVLVVDDDDPEGERLVAVDLPPNSNVKFYQDRRNGAFFTGECQHEQYGPCTRRLTGNVVINGQEYKLEPTNEHMDTRGFSAHLGTPHSLEALETRTLTTEQTGDNGAVMLTEADVVIPEQDEGLQNTQNIDTALSLEEEQYMLRTLLEKLRTLEKRAAPKAHGVELLLAIDHVILQEFLLRYPRRSDALFAIRQYFSHIVNGVDLRYATIQEDDISIYVTIAGFFVSKSVSQSPWMDYSESPTNGMNALKVMRNWRKTKGLPAHDHATLITGSNIQGSGVVEVAGLAFLGAICTYASVSVTENRGFFKGSGILAHELGHNLGAMLDLGPEGSGCFKDDDFIMAPYVPSVTSSSRHIAPWRFSSCSINKIRQHLIGLGNSACTLDRVSVDDEEFNMHTQGLAGQLYTEDEQCELLRGVGATMCSAKNTPEVCRKFGCKSKGSKDCYPYVAAHGTPCGRGRMCFEGICQIVECTGRDCEDDNGGGDTTSAPETTTVMSKTTESDRYLCFNSGVAGYSCPELLKFFGSKRLLCSKYAHECCEMCTDRRFCKQESEVVTIEATYSCSHVVKLFGHNDACRLFTRQCCMTCRT